MIHDILIVNKETNLNVRMNDDNAEYLLEEGSIDWGEVITQHSTYSYPNQIGEFISNTVIKAREIQIFGWIVGDDVIDSTGQITYTAYDEIKRKKRQLNNFLNPFQEVEIVANGYKITGKPSGPVRYSKTSKENNEYMCKFLFSIFCHDPMFYSVYPSTFAAAEVSPKFMFPLIFTPTYGTIMGLKKQSLFTDIVNSGAVPTGALITITAKGEVNNLKIFKVLKSDEFIKFNHQLKAGDTIVVNTVEGFISSNATIDGITTRLFPDFDSTWLQFNVGTTVIGFSTEVDGVPDETYKNVDITVENYTKHFNLEEE